MCTWLPSAAVLLVCVTSQFFAAKAASARGFLHATSANSSSLEHKRIMAMLQASTAYGPFPTKWEACDACFKSYSKTGVPTNTGTPTELQPHCTCLAFAEPLPTENDLRLVSGSTDTMGRLEIFYDGEWGTICDKDFGQDEADIACRQLGYTQGAMPGQGDITDAEAGGSGKGYFTGAAFGEGTGGWHFNNLQTGEVFDHAWFRPKCGGSETKLSDCSVSGGDNELGKSRCSHKYDVGISCKGTVTSTPASTGNQNGGYNMFCADSEPGVAYVKNYKKKGCACHGRDMEHTANTMCYALE